jgi:hypothetical protein
MMARKYKRLTLVLTCPEDEAEEIEHLLDEALDTIEAENNIFDDEMTWEDDVAQPEETEDDDEDD